MVSISFIQTVCVCVTVRETLAIVSTRKTFRLCNIGFFLRSRLKTAFCDTRKTSVLGGRRRDRRQHPALQPRVTCPQGAVGPVEKEHRIAAQPPQRLIRRSPDVVEVAFLAVIIEQGLRERRPLVTRANTSPRDGTAQSRLAARPRLRLHRPLQGPLRGPSPSRPHTRGEARSGRAPGGSSYLLHLGVHSCYPAPLRGARGRVRERVAARCYWLACRSTHGHWLGGKGGGRDTGRKTYGKRRDVSGGSLGSRETGAGPPGGEAPYHWGRGGV